MQHAVDGFVFELEPGSDLTSSEAIAALLSQGLQASLSSCCIGNT